MKRVIEPKLCLLTHDELMNPGFYNQLIMANKDKAKINNNNNNNNVIIIIMIMAKQLWAKLLLPTYQVNAFFQTLPSKIFKTVEKDKRTNDHFLLLLSVA
jgi:hypothetical protein